MGFKFGNALAAITDTNIVACLQRLGKSHGESHSTLNTLVRNAESTSDLIAGYGLTGGGQLNSGTSVTFAVDSSVIVSGSGTTGRIPKFTATGVIGNSSFAEVLAGTGVLSLAWGNQPNRTATFFDPGGDFAVVPTLFGGTAGQPMIWGASTLDAAPNPALLTPTYLPMFAAGGIGFEDTQIHMTTGKVNMACNDLDLIGSNAGPNVIKIGNTSVAGKLTITYPILGGLVTFDNQSPTGSYSFTGNTTGPVITVVGPNGIQASTLTLLGTSTAEALLSANGAVSSSAIAGGAKFTITGLASAGTTVGPKANCVFGAAFSAASGTSAAANVFAGMFFNQGIITSFTYTQMYAAYMRGVHSYSTSSSGSGVTTEAGGLLIGASASPVVGSPTVTTWNQLKIENTRTGANTKPVITTAHSINIDEQTKGATNYGIFLANATAGYKAIAIRDIDAWIGSSATAQIDIGATNFKVQSTNIGFFNHAVAAQPSAYTPSNVSADRSFDANSTTVDELADVLGTLIADLQTMGLVA